MKALQIVFTQDSLNDAHSSTSIVLRVNHPQTAPCTLDKRFWQDLMLSQPNLFTGSCCIQITPVGNLFGHEFQQITLADNKIVTN